MTNEMKLITALCDALGFDEEKTCVNEWNESSKPPKRPKFIQEMIREGERIQDETEKRIANFMIDGKTEFFEGKA
jgi:hypothetical protein